MVNWECAFHHICPIFVPFFHLGCIILKVSWLNWPRNRSEYNYPNLYFAKFMLHLSWIKKVPASKKKELHRGSSIEKAPCVAQPPPPHLQVYFSI